MMTKIQMVQLIFHLVVLVISSVSLGYSLCELVDSKRESEEEYLEDEGEELLGDEESDTAPLLRAIIELSDKCGTLEELRASLKRIAKGNG